MKVTWKLGVADPTGLSLYRDDELLSNPQAEEGAYQDTGLEPNTRYSYRLVVEREEGSEAAAESSAATLAHRPKLAEQMATTWTGLQQPIVDELNPDHTEYRIILDRVDGGHTSASDWSVSKCRTFDNLEPESYYRVTAVARNLDGIETEPADRRAGGDNFWSGPLRVFTRKHSGTEDPWVKARIRDAAAIHGLTEAAVEWMTNDILIEWKRGEPGWAGYIHGYVGIGHSNPGVLVHEAMHAFWEFWDGFPEPCDQMNLYTFRRDVARFALDFREYERNRDSENPLEPWRPYYDMMLGMLRSTTNAHLGGEDAWEILERDEYTRLWWGFYHALETTIPGYNPQNLLLAPPSLQKYLRGFMKLGEGGSWERVFNWYLRLRTEDLVLWRPFFSHDLTYNARGLRTPFGQRTEISEPLRSTLREAERQLLIDFINTLKDVEKWEWWDRDPRFWANYVTQHLYRASLYGSELELELSMGIEDLDEAGLGAVVEALQSLYHLHCKPDILGGCGYSFGYRGRSSGATRNLIENLEGLPDAKRRILLEMIDLGKG